jgi:predicted acetylornithine/succinylornithine family transaminase
MQKIGSNNSLKQDIPSDHKDDIQKNKFDEIKKLDEKNHFQIYNRIPILLVDGKGSRVTDSTGKEYIDMLGGIAVNSLGHCHPAVVTAISEQAKKIIHCSNLYYIEPQAKLAELLIKNSEMDRILFCNSGSEAVEGAIKLARRWGKNHHRGGEIITMSGSFHGRTLAAVTATGQEKYKKDFDPLPIGFKVVPFNDFNALTEQIDNNICAIMLEPVQGEGGIRIADTEYLEKVRRLCDDENILLIFDEVQCGISRTGHLFAYQGFEVIPDIVTIAKALGGGFPIGALLAKEEVARQFGFGDHGTTFGGNPLATAAAYATVSTMIQEDLSNRSKKLGEYLLSTLREKTSGYDVVDEVRGRGLMVGVVLKKNCKEVVRIMIEKGVLSNCTADLVIRFVPPLTISKEDLDIAINVLIESMNEVYPNDQS